MFLFEELTTAEAIAERAVVAIEAAGIGLDAAVWTENDYGHGRLYVVPREPHGDNGVASVELQVADIVRDFPRVRLLKSSFTYDVVNERHPIIVSVAEQHPGRCEMPTVVRGSYGGGTFLDRAVVYRWSLPD